MDPLEVYNERKIVKRKEINYKGIFEIKELIKEIKKILRENKFVVFEESHDYSISEEEKEISFKLTPYKVVKENIIEVIIIKINLKNVKEKVIKISRRRMHVYYGDINIDISGWIYANTSWLLEKAPMFEVIKEFIKKYIYRREDPHEVDVGKTVNILWQELKSFLGLYRYYPH